VEKYTPIWSTGIPLDLAKMHSLQRWSNLRHCFSTVSCYNGAIWGNAFL